MASIASTANLMSVFKLIEAASQIQQNRLMPTPDYIDWEHSREKAQAIMGAIDRLSQAILHKIKPKVYEDFTPAYSGDADRVYDRKIQLAQVDRMDLSTIDAMFDARINKFESEIERYTISGDDYPGRRAGYYRQLSLRQSLNIARKNPFNCFGAEWGPLWGSSTALLEVEEAVRKALARQKRH